MFEIILFLLGIVIMFWFGIKRANAAENKIEKIVYYLYPVIAAIPYAIYAIDRYDVFTRFGWTENIDTNRWFNFIGTYVSGIIGATISAFVLIHVTKEQIEADNLRKEIDLKEQRRVNNMPILKYGCSFYNSEPHSSIFVMKNVENDSKDACLIAFDVENIGLNTALGIKCNLKTKDGKYDADSVDENYVLKVGDKETFGLLVCFDFKEWKNRDIIVTFYYEDLFNNCYSQEIHATVSFKQKHDDKFVNYDVSSWKDFKVNPGEQIKE